MCDRRTQRQWRRGGHVQTALRFPVVRGISHDRSRLGLFVLSSVIWGVPYLSIKIAVDADVPPAFIAWSRVALAATLLLPLAIRRKAFRALRDRASAVFAYTASEVAVPFVLIAIGEQYISSSLTAILVATLRPLSARFPSSA
jgi:drug/metabolite transporter (DMT)-like permease